MSEENEFESLFAEFDGAVEAGPPPEVPESFVYTRTRGLGAWDRLSRWLVQGPGLLLIFFLFFIYSIAKEPEMGLNLVGVLLTLWVVSPLLGKRPLAHPLRVAGLLLPAFLMLGTSVIIVRCGIENVELFKNPLVYFTRVGINVVEAATEPKVALSIVAAALGLLILGRFLATRNPWLDGSFNPPRWRKVTSLLLLGLMFGSLATVPIAYKVAWGQSWMNAPMPAEANFPPIKNSEPGDLGDQFPLYRIDSVPESEQSIREKLKAATHRLDTSITLTRADYNLINALADYGRQTEAQDSDLTDFAWAGFTHQARGGMSNNRLHKAFAKHVLVPLGQSSELSSWKKKIAALPPTTTYQWSQLDSALAKDIKETGDRSARHRPNLRLFGMETPFNTGTLIWRVETTPQLLLYIHARHRRTPSELVKRLFRNDYIWPLDESWDSLFRPIITSLRELPGAQDHDYLRNRELLDLIVKLRTDKAKNGRYPEQIENLPVATHYVVGELSNATLIDEMYLVEIKLP